MYQIALPEASLIDLINSTNNSRALETWLLCKKYTLNYYVLSNSGSRNGGMWHAVSFSFTAVAPRFGKSCNTRYIFLCIKPIWLPSYAADTELDHFMYCKSCKLPQGWRKMADKKKWWWSLLDETRVCNQDSRNTHLLATWFVHKFLFCTWKAHSDCEEHLLDAQEVTGRTFGGIILMEALMVVFPCNALQVL